MTAKTTKIIRCALSASLFLAALAASPAQAFPELSGSLSGRFYADVYAPFSASPYSLQQLSASDWLEGDAKIGDHLFSRLIFQGDGIPTSVFPSSVGVRENLREGYAGYSSSGFEVRVGKQILPWGKSDGINPTDYLTARDYSIFNPDDEVRRLGSTGVWIAWTPLRGNSPITFTGVWNILPALGRLGIPANLIPPGTSVSSNPTSPGFGLSNSEGAFKFAYAGPSYDFSLSAFRGWNHAPLLTPDPNSSAGNIIQVFQYQDALGGDFSCNFGNWVIRAETSYTWTDNDDGSAPYREPSHFDWVAGAERPLGDSFRVQAQFLWRYIPQPAVLSGPTVLPALAEADALLLGYQDQSRPGATLRISYSRDESLFDAEILVLENFGRGDGLLRPKISKGFGGIRAGDSIRLSLGFDYYSGSIDSPLGALNSLSAAFFETKYSF